MLVHTVCHDHRASIDKVALGEVLGTLVDKFGEYHTNEGIHFFT